MQPVLDPAGGPGDLAGDEGLPPHRRLVVKENAVQFRALLGIPK